MVGTAEQLNFNDLNLCTHPQLVARPGNYRLAVIAISLWHLPLDVASVEGQFLEQLLSDLTDDDNVEPHQREQFIEKCKTAASAHTGYVDLLNTLIEAAHYLPNDDGTVDANITNVMLC